MTEASIQRTQHLLRSSLFVLIILGINKITGFAKLLLMTQAFGTGSEADAFAAANQLPELFLALLSGGALSAALIPVYSAYLTSAEPDKAKALANTIFSLTFLSLGTTCGLAALYAPWLAQTLLVPEFTPSQQILTANLMRISLISTATFGISSVVTSLLHAHQHFLAPAWGTVMIDSGQIIGLYFLVPIWGIYGVAWGTVIGAILAIAIQFPAFFQRRITSFPWERNRLQLNLRLAGIREILHLMWPRVITLGTHQAVDIVFIRLASPLPDGSISAYFYALLLMLGLPKSLFGSAITTVIFPTLTEQYHEGDLRGLKNTTQQALLAVWIFIIPAAIGFIALGEPAVAFLLQRGSFGAEATSLVYTLLIVMAFRLISEAAIDVLSLPFYARHNTRIPMWANLGWMGLNISLSFLLVTPWGIQGLTWATALAALALALGLYYLNRREIGPFDEAKIGQTLKRILFACLGLTLVVWAIAQADLSRSAFLILTISLGMLTYLGLYILLGGREIIDVWRLLQDKLHDE